MIDLAVLRQIIIDNGLIIKIKNDNYDETECLMNVADDLELLLEPKNNTWVSVKNKLPKHEQEVLICIENKGISIGYYNRKKDEWFTQCNEEWYFPITHWQPLPKPPKE